MGSGADTAGFCSWDSFSSLSFWPVFLGKWLQIEAFDLETDRFFWVARVLQKSFLLTFLYFHKVDFETFKIPLTKIVLQERKKCKNKLPCSQSKRQRRCNRQILLSPVVLIFIWHAAIFRSLYFLKKFAFCQKEYHANICKLLTLFLHIGYILIKLPRLQGQ